MEKLKKLNKHSYARASFFIPDEFKLSSSKYGDIFKSKSFSFMYIRKLKKSGSIGLLFNIRGNIDAILESILTEYAVLIAVIFFLSNSIEVVIMAVLA